MGRYPNQVQSGFACQMGLGGGRKWGGGDGLGDGRRCLCRYRYEMEKVEEMAEIAAGLWSGNAVVGTLYLGRGTGVFGG